MKLGNTGVHGSTTTAADPADWYPHPLSQPTLQIALSQDKPSVAIAVWAVGFMLLDAQLHLQGLLDELQKLLAVCCLHQLQVGFSLLP